MRAEIRVRSRDGENLVFKLNQDGESIELYRSLEEDHHTVVNNNGDIYVTDICDASVSKKNGGENGRGYIEILKRRSQIYVKDHGSSYDTYLRNGWGEEVIGTEEKYPLHTDSTVKLSDKEDSSVKIKVIEEYDDITWILMKEKIEAFEKIVETGSVEKIDQWSERIDKYIGSINKNSKYEDDIKEIQNNFNTVTNLVSNITDTNDEKSMSEVKSRCKTVCQGIKGKIDNIEAEN